MSHCIVRADKRPFNISNLSLRGECLQCRLHCCCLLPAACPWPVLAAGKGIVTRGSNSSSRLRSDRHGSSSARVISPSKLEGNVFVGRFRSKLGPYQVRGVAAAFSSTCPAMVLLQRSRCEFSRHNALVQQPNYCVAGQSVQQVVPQPELMLDMHCCCVVELPL